MDIGKPLRRHTVVPMTQPVPETGEPRAIPAPSVPERAPALPAPGLPERIEEPVR